MDQSSRNASLARHAQADRRSARARAARFLAALAMTAVTMAVMVVLPAKLESTGGVLAQQNAIAVAHASRIFELARAHVDSSH